MQSKVKNIQIYEFYHFCISQKGRMGCGIKGPPAETLMEGSDDDVDGSEMVSIFLLFLRVSVLRGRNLSLFT